MLTNRGDKKTIEKVCALGLSEQLTSLISQRSKQQHAGERLEWKRLSVTAPPRLVSLLVAPVSLSGNDVACQAVYRIKSLQSLAKYTPSGNLVGDTDKPREIVEYLVLHRRSWAQPKGKWEVYGKVEETSPDAVKVKKLLDAGDGKTTTTQEVYQVVNMDEGKELKKKK